MILVLSLNHIKLLLPSINHYLLRRGGLPTVYTRSPFPPFSLSIFYFTAHFFLFVCSIHVFPQPGVRETDFLMVLWQRD
jgi:hypothetical protein